MSRFAMPATVPHPAPPVTTRTPRFESSRVLLGILLGLVLASFLASASLVEIAGRLEFGPGRDRWLAAAETVDEASHLLLLDRPGDWIRRSLGYDDVPEGVVIGQLAVVEPEYVALPPAEIVPPESDPPAPEPEVNPTVVPAEVEPEVPAEVKPVQIPDLRVISPSDPLRIWMGGDSLGQYVANHVAYRVAPTDRTDITLDYHVSTGLTRPDYFDWPARFTEVTQADPRPEAYVFMVGGNDDQAMRLQDVVLETGTPEWLEEYRRRVGLLMDVVAYPDTRLFWVLLPPMESPSRQQTSEAINESITAQAALRPWVSIVAIDDLFISPDGGFATFVDDPDGDRKLARQSDGVHITEVGSEWVAERVWRQVIDAWPGAEVSEELGGAGPATVDGTGARSDAVSGLG